MKVSRYLTIFTVTARWFLPQEKAHEIVDNCHHLFETSFCSDDTIVARNKSPFQAARYFVQVEIYRRWLVAFSTMILCLVVPTVLLFSWNNHPVIAVASLLIGGIISLVWFRSEKRECQSAPRLLLIMLSIFIVVWGSVTATILFVLFDPETAFSFLSFSQPVYIGKSFTCWLALGCYHL